MNTQKSPSFSQRFIAKNPALQTPLFRRYLSMRYLLILALLMQFTIINYWVYHLSGLDVWAVGKLGLCEAVPAVLCSLVSGHYVDQNEKKKMLMICLGGYLLVSGFFAMLAMPSTIASWGANTVELCIYAGTFVGGVLRSFLSPSQFSMMGLLLPKRHYPNGTTWSSTAWQTGAVTGPLIGGFLIGYTHERYAECLWVVFGLIVIASAILLTIPAQQVIKKIKEPILKSLQEGLRFVMRTQVIVAALSLDMFAVLFGGAIALLPVFSEKILHLTPIEYGWLNAAESMGSITTLFLLSFYPLKHKPGTRLLMYVAGFGLAIICFAISKNFWLSLGLLYVAGMCDGVSVVIRGTILQMKTPDDMRGRVGAVNTMFISSSNEIGRAESGFMAKQMGLVPSVVFGGVMTLLVVGATWIFAPSLRKFDLNED